MNARMVTLFWLSEGGRHHSSFWASSLLQNSQGHPISGDVKYTGWENLMFAKEIAVLLWNGIGPWLDYQQAVIGSRSIRVGSDDLEWHSKTGRDGANISGGSPHVRSYRLRSYFACGEGRFGGSAMPRILNGMAPSSQNFGTPSYNTHTVWPEQPRSAW